MNNIVLFDYFAISMVKANALVFLRDSIEPGGCHSDWKHFIKHGHGGLQDRCQARIDSYKNNDQN